MVKKELQTCFNNYPKQVLICSLEDVDSVYTCFIKNIQIKENEEISITANHQAGKSDSDVDSVIFLGSKLHEIPLIIFSKFQNLKEVNKNWIIWKIVDFWRLWERPSTTSLKSRMTPSKIENYRSSVQQNRKARKNCFQAQRKAPGNQLGSQCDRTNGTLWIPEQSRGTPIPQLAR